MRGYSTSPGADVVGEGDDSGSLAKLETGDPFATLFKLPKTRDNPSTYALGVLSAIARPSADARVGTAGGVVVKGRLMKLIPDASGSTFEWTSQELDAFSYACNLKLVSS